MRKSLFARRDLVEKLMAIAKDKGLSLYSLVNQIFEYYVNLEDMGVSLRELTDKISFYRRALGSGFILIPKDLWFLALEKMYNCVEEYALKWREAGVRVGKYYQSLGVEDAFSTMVRDLEKILSWISEVSLTIDGDRVRIVIADPRLDEKLVKLVLELLRGAFEVYGYQLDEVENIGLVARAVFSRR